jgi:hypothetical protein
MLKKIYRTVIQMTVLSEEPIGDVEMQEILNQTDSGDWIGHNVTQVQDEILTGTKAVVAIEDTGSDTEFFRMDKSGNELEFQD